MCWSRWEQTLSRTLSPALLASRPPAPWSASRAAGTWLNPLPSRSPRFGRPSKRHERGRFVSARGHDRIGLRPEARWASLRHLTDDLEILHGAEVVDKNGEGDLLQEVALALHGDGALVPRGFAKTK